MTPYYATLKYLSKGESESEKEQIRKDFEESFAYLLIAEQGKDSPCYGGFKRFI